MLDFLFLIGGAVVDMRLGILSSFEFFPGFGFRAVRDSGLSAYSLKADDIHDASKSVGVIGRMGPKTLFVVDFGFKSITTRGYFVFTGGEFNTNLKRDSAKLAGFKKFASAPPHLGDAIMIDFTSGTTIGGGGRTVGGNGSVFDLNDFIGPFGADDGGDATACAGAVETETSGTDFSALAFIDATSSDDIIAFFDRGVLELDLDDFEDLDAGFVSFDVAKFSETDFASVTTECGVEKSNKFTMREPAKRETVDRVVFFQHVFADDDVAGAVGRPEATRLRPVSEGLFLIGTAGSGPVGTGVEKGPLIAT